ncbi:MAG: Tm-1-like ATP-binding domain-containing protein [Pirellulales bacterium]|nr:Tm-1-like ATP-binding domain-containing protein [Pirellulales bacterium]
MPFCYHGDVGLTFLTPSASRAMTPSIYAIATMDSKGQEIAYVAGEIRAAGANVVTVDVGAKGPPSVPPDVDRQTVLACHPRGAAAPDALDRGQAVAWMSEALVAFLLREHAAGRVAGVIGLGGSGGTALVAPAMRALPIGLPKLLVSTVASGNTAPYVGCCDVTMMYSVVDVAGINGVSRIVLGNAARAIAGMASRAAAPESPRTAIGMTMFGVTTPCVNVVRERLEQSGHECLVFHATGTGGQAMEKLVESGLIGGVLDVTTTEVADEVVGGVFPAGPARFDAILAKRIPYVLSLGALDMVNFGAKHTVPERFRERTLYVHNSEVTLMRTTPEENRRIARWIAEKLSRATAPWILLIPEGGVSAIDAPGMPFWDPAADRALFSELDAALEPTPDRQIRRLAHHVNDPAFAQALVDAYVEVSKKTTSST